MTAEVRRRSLYSAK